jgi:hypothetical protein
MAAKSNTITMTFTKEKETKGTVRYMEDGDKEQHSVGALYVQKSAYALMNSPEAITVTVTAS